MNKIILSNLARYESFIFVGTIMTGATLLKLLGVLEFSSDWLWLIAGLGLMVEGAISLAKQKNFEKKYKVIEVGSPEYQKLTASNEK
jgi:sulfite exporter TauE/SafE